MIVGILCVVGIIAGKVYSSMRNKVMVSVVHGNNVVLKFDPYKDATYDVEGSYGGLQIEVKDAKWHVINEECPNHLCAQQGWMGVDDIFPIVCLPNDVMIYIEEK